MSNKNGMFCRYLSSPSIANMGTRLKSDAFKRFSRRYSRPSRQRKIRILTGNLRETFGFKVIAGWRVRGSTKTLLPRRRFPSPFCFSISWYETCCTVATEAGFMRVCKESRSEGYSLIDRKHYTTVSRDIEHNSITRVRGTRCVDRAHDDGTRVARIKHVCSIYSFYFLSTLPTCYLQCRCSVDVYVNFYDHQTGNKCPVFSILTYL